MVALGALAQWKNQQKQSTMSPTELLPREATRRERVARIIDVLLVVGHSMNFLDLHKAAGEPRDRSDFRKLLREMAEEDGSIQIEKAAYAPKGESPLTIRLMAPADSAPEEPEEPAHRQPTAVNGLPLARWRKRYHMLCSLIRALGEGGVHQVEHLREPFEGSGLFFDTIVANLKNRRAVTAPSDAMLTAETLELQKVWDSEEALCSVAGWPAAPHAKHVTVLLNGGTLIEEAGAFAELNALLGFTLVAHRVGISRSTAFTLQWWSRMDRDVLEFASEHDVARSMVLTLKNAEPSRRMDLLRRAVEENLTAREVHEVATNGELSVFDVELSKAGDAVAPAAQTARDPALDILIKMVFGIAGDVSALTQRVDWLAKELGYKEKSA